ncbi:MAG: hypothetical protein WCF94_01435 [bacterium]
MSFPTKILLGIMGVFLLVPFVVGAQTKPEASLDITLNPSTPGANSTVVANVNSIDYAKNIDTYNIIWTLNGKKIAEGIGMKEVTFRTGSVGSSISLDVLATSDKIRLSGAVSFSLGSVALIWESNSYVSPFYKGKKLSAQGATFKVIAVPEITTNGKSVSSGNLIYNWYQNDNLISDKSGYGKNIFSNYDNTYVLDGNTIKVKVLSPGGALAMTGTTFIPHTKPMILFYENDPSLGLLYNRELSDKKIVEQTSKIDAEPFYFSANKYSNKLTYDWVSEENSVSKKYQVSPSSISSKYGVSLTITHLDKMFQKITSSLTLSSNYSFDDMLKNILSQ